jgi:hypothetical protein
MIKPTDRVPEPAAFATNCTSEKLPRVLAGMH